MGKYFIKAEQLWAATGSPDAPLVVDTRRRKVFDADPHIIPGALWWDHMDIASLAEGPGRDRDIVVYCAHGHNVSELAVGVLREMGVSTRSLRGGIEAWRDASLPVVTKAEIPGLSTDSPSKWVTRRRPKIDRVACPWLIRRFFDPRAEFYYVEPDYVLAVAEEMGGTAYDIDGAPVTHDGELCSFDVLLKNSGLNDPALDTLARIIRGADTARLDLAPESAGLLAAAIGISAIAGEDDHETLERGMALYDALYAWQRKAPGETHNWPAGSAK